MRLHLGLLLGACALSIVLSLVRCAHVASRGDFETVAEAVRSAYQPGDLVVAVPFHQGAPRLLLGDLPLIEPRRLEPDLLRLHPRILLIATNAIGARDDLVDGIRALGATQEIARSGPVRAMVITVSDPMHPTFELRAAVHDLAVSADQGGQAPAACDIWAGNRWTCPRGEGWNWVGSATLAMETGPRACVWMHPLDRNRELSVTLPETQGSKMILGHGFAAGASGRAPLHVEVRRGEATLASYDVAPRSDWSTETIALGSAVGPLTLAVRTRDNGGAHFCADAWVVE